MLRTYSIHTYCYAAPNHFCQINSQCIGIKCLLESKRFDLQASFGEQFFAHFLRNHRIIDISFERVTENMDVTSGNRVIGALGKALKINLQYGGKNCSFYR